MKKPIKIVLVIVLLMVISVLGYIGYRYLESTILCNKMDYIQLADTGEIIELDSVKTSVPALWKGERAGTLYYKDGESASVDVSFYGNFFAFSGERALRIFKYTVK